MAEPRSFVFAGSSVGEPWYVVGEVTTRLLEPLGYQINIETKSSGPNNLRFVGRGDALVGCTMPYFILMAQEGRHEYEGETFPEFRAIAMIHRPSWIGFAATVESGIQSLDEVRERKMPIRFLSGGNRNAIVPRTIFAHHGLSLETVESWGGKLLPMGHHPLASYLEEGGIDVVLWELYLGTTPITKYWLEVSLALNLHFIDLEEAVIDKLCKDVHLERGLLPNRLVRGLDRDVRTVGMPTLIVYAKSDLSDELAYLLARSYDENRTAFLETPLHMAYDPATVAKAPIPLHPGADRYYRERGYLS